MLLKYIIFVFIIFISSCGKYSTDENYGYDDLNNSINYNWGKINIYLTPERDTQLNEKLSIASTPYELNFYLEFKNGVSKECKINLKTIQIKNNQNVYFEKTNLNINGRNSALNKGKYLFRNSLLIKNINLDYKNYDILFKVIMDENCLAHKEEISDHIFLKTNFVKKDISFWDVIMGV